MDDCRTLGPGRTLARAFTLIEVMVVVAVIAILVGILLPALAHAREGGRTAVCQSNLRQMFLICRSYADENRGYGPAIGEPYTTLPNWALVVQAATGLEGTTPGELYSARSVLVCPAVAAAYPERMVRTYAMNATGHAGQPASGGRAADRDNYDDPAHGAYIHLDRAEDWPGPLFVDSKRGMLAPPAPPPTRTLSPIDFRQTSHVSGRLGRFHPGSAFNAVLMDGSAQTQRDVRENWLEPLP